MDGSRQSRRLVRMYSFDVDDRIGPGSSAYPLGSALAHTRGDIRDLTAPWRAFFEPAENEADDRELIPRVILTESANLRKQWRKFREHCQEGDRLDLDASEPTIQGVLNTVRDFKNKWQGERENSRRYRFMKQIHRFTDCLDSHKSLLEILPQGSEYVSLFTGTASVLIKASVNHEQLAEGLSRTLCEMGECIADCEIDLELFKTQRMIKAVSVLYSHIFSLLSDLLNYCSKSSAKRLLDSFNDKLYEEHEAKLGEIRKQGAKIKEIAAQGSHAELRATRIIAEDTNITLEELRQDVKVGLEGQARYEAEMLDYAERMEKNMSRMMEQRMEVPEMLQQLANRVFGFLEGSGHSWIIENRASSCRLRNTSSIPTLGGSGMTYNVGQQARPNESQHLLLQPSHISEAEWTSDQVQVDSSHIEDFFDRARIRLTGEFLRPVMVPPLALKRIAEWLGNEANFLWIEGPFIQAMDSDNAISLVAANVVELVAQSGVCVISYFCQLPGSRELRDGNSTPEVQAFIALLCGLLRQAVEHLIPRFTARVDLSQKRFRLVNGKMETWSETLDLLDDVLTALDMRLVCVIDGVHWLDDRSADLMFAALIDTLRTSRIKTLLTTTGRSACLRRRLSFSETFPMQQVDERSASYRLDQTTLEVVTD
ncbi:hypothetical protein KVR01_000165 [Diaporthe batatas]|uniref:uncharacterized protein n=1 Tax=Diaporthe batatas TaxID=748121 RepID=UPI001D03C51D|nr:uncharacterized protein KVR01_000165 [Diaporthe batatas]KAG8169420.1 hypothetical protein KVR01_000165 [Diaporthe batatas]